jgi:hypothetical protein
VSGAARLDLDALDLAAVRGGALRGVPVAVLGLARTGIALARFFADAGARVRVYDGKPAEALAEAVGALEGRPVELACGRRWRRTSSAATRRTLSSWAATSGRRWSTAWTRSPRTVES